VSESLLTLADAARIMREAVRDRSYRSTPLGLEVAHYYRWKKNEWGATKETLRDYEAILAKLALDHADLDLVDFAPPVGTERLREFIDNRWGERTPRTRAKVISVLRDFFAWAVRERGLTGNPAVPIFRPRKRDIARGTFTPADVAKVVTAQARQRDRVALLLLFRLGLRKGGLARVQFKHYDGRRLTIFGKGGKVRYLPVVDGGLRLGLERHILDRGPDPDEFLLYPEKVGPEFYRGPLATIWEDRRRPLFPHGDAPLVGRMPATGRAAAPADARGEAHGDHRLPPPHGQPETRADAGRSRRHRHHREHLRAPGHDRPRSRPEGAGRGLNPDGTPNRSDRKPAVCGDDGGGGNRTRVRGRTGKSLYKRSLRFAFARQPVRRRPTDGLALLWRPASGEWLSLRGEPVF
jgi:integrase